MRALAISIYQRYTGPYSDEQRLHIETMMNKRVVVTIDVAKVVSWDHRKLGPA